MLADMGTLTSRTIRAFYGEDRMALDVSELIDSLGAVRSILSVIRWALSSRSSSPAAIGACAAL
jgi:hypothetical protein